MQVSSVVMYVVRFLSVDEPNIASGFSRSNDSNCVECERFRRVASLDEFRMVSGQRVFQRHEGHFLSLSKIGFPQISHNPGCVGSGGVFSVSAGIGGKKAISVMPSRYAGVVSNAFARNLRLLVVGVDFPFSQLVIVAILTPTSSDKANLLSDNFLRSSDTRLPYIIAPV